MFDKDWKKFLEAELAEEEDDDENYILDPKEIIPNLVNYSTQKLCNMIVCDRYLGLNKEIRIGCMEELAKRRLAGDSFLYEEYIEKTLTDLPKIDTSLDLSDFISKFNSK